ncbi:MAG TPA: hypothetical protein VEH29_13345 [Acidimicrobiales bacterium]|nr:hypothetical protein [Acidimicrobiales bacterium]
MPREKEDTDWERMLLQIIEGHVHAETELEDAYRELRQSVAAGDIEYLITLILEDEHRHHHWFSELAQSLSALADGSASPAIPWLGAIDDRAQLLAATKQFLKFEREDARQLRNLLRELQAMEETTLWPLLVRLMLSDTEKHIEILRFIERRAKGPAIAPAGTHVASRSPHSA